MSDNMPKPRPFFLIRSAEHTHAPIADREKFEQDTAQLLSALRKPEQSDISPTNTERTIMRDPKRIGRILGKLRQEWEAAPDLRFTQLLANIGINEHTQNYGELGLKEPGHDFPPNPMIRDNYYVEDDVIERTIDIHRTVNGTP